jgi:phenylacetic acid degradation operon negative regulatory protein
MRANPIALRPDPHVQRWIARELATAPPKARSLVITVWGDAIAPHGGAVMLPGLIRLLATLGVGERLARTSVFRLAREGWLTANRIGRRSLYRLTKDGAHRFVQAYRRIYWPVDESWDDSWEIVLADGLDARRRVRLRDDLRWDGFGILAPGVYARPAQPVDVVATIAAPRSTSGRIIAFRARDDGSLGGAPLASAVTRAWDLSRIAADYRKFLRRFGGVIERFRAMDAVDHDPRQSFAVRTLLIHEYRRVLLRDPRLPASLLPLDWPGSAAYALCRDFYRLTHKSAERHLLALLEGPRGVLPPANAAFYERFGGIDDAPSARPRRHSSR